MHTISYMFDEPSSYLDVKQRLAAARSIRGLLNPDDYVIVVEHDLSVLDYLSDFICVLYGRAALFGVVTLPQSVREGINIFLDGHIPTENLRFRDESLTFRIAEAGEEFLSDKARAFHYPTMEKTLGGFHLKVESGKFTDSEIVVMMGENGTGKSTFCKMLAGAEKPDGDIAVPRMNISMKPQKITPKFQGTVRQLFFKRIKAAFLSPQFQTEVYKPLKIDDFIDQEVQNLSGGELQRVAIVLALGLPADIYLIDEPSAYLDSEQRIVAARVIKRFIMHAKKTAFIVEHDFIMATYLADRVVVFGGKPSIDAYADTPESLLTGCNKFLQSLDVTFRRDPNTYRPRINKYQSQMDKEQKLHGNYVSLRSDNFSCPHTINTNFLCSTSWKKKRAEKGVPHNHHRDHHRHDGRDSDQRRNRRRGGRMVIRLGAFSSSSSSNIRRTSVSRARKKRGSGSCSCSFDDEGEDEDEDDGNGAEEDETMTRMTTTTRLRRSAFSSPLFRSIRFSFLPRCPKRSQLLLSYPTSPTCHAPSPAEIRFRLLSRSDYLSCLSGMLFSRTEKVKRKKQRKVFSVSCRRRYDVHGLVWFGLFDF